MSGSRVRIGIAGLGRMGARHARNLALRCPGAELVAACSPVAAERAWAKMKFIPARIACGMSSRFPGGWSPERKPAETTVNGSLSGIQ